MTQPCYNTRPDLIALPIHSLSTFVEEPASRFNLFKQSEQSEAASNKPKAFQHDDAKLVSDRFGPEVKALAP